VKLAFYGIDATRVAVEAGRITPEEGSSSRTDIGRSFETTSTTSGPRLKLLATSGRASDVPALNKLLSAVLAVARQDGLVGREELAAKAMETMTYALNTFSQQFAATCAEQSLDSGSPSSITAGSIRHCSSRERLRASMLFGIDLISGARHAD
jgi:hypothetical protein